MNENDGVQMYSTIELFAGAGGLALGVEKAGFEPLALIELNKDACNTLQKNRPGWNVICDDIANISKLDLKEYFDDYLELQICNNLTLAKIWLFISSRRDFIISYQYSARTLMLDN